METLQKECLRTAEREFDRTTSLTNMPGIVVQLLLSYMLRRRRVGSRSLTDINIVRFLTHPGVVHLDLNSVWLHDGPFLHTACRHLRYLNLKGALRMTDVGVQHIARACPELEYINLVGNRLSDTSLYALSENCSQLQMVALQSASQSDKPQCKSKHRESRARAKPSQKAKEQSQTTTAATDKGKEPEGMQAQEDDEQPISVVTDDGVVALVRACKELRVLKLVRCHKVTDSGIHAISRGCSRLEQLSIIDNNSVSAHLFSLLASNPTHHDTEEGENRHTNASFMTKLRILSVGKCSNIKTSQASIGECMRQGSLCYYPSLVKLKIADCDNISSLSFLRVPDPQPAPSSHIGATSCPLLQEIYIIRCRRVSDATLKDIFPVAAQLRVLELRELTKITCHAVRTLLLGCARKYRLMAKLAEEIEKAERRKRAEQELKERKRLARIKAREERQRRKEEGAEGATAQPSESPQLQATAETVVSQPDVPENEESWDESDTIEGEEDESHHVLERLAVHRCNFLGGNIFDVRVPVPSSLTSLDLAHTAVNRCTFESNTHLRLSTVDLSVTEINDASLLQILTNCPAIQSLRLEACQALKDASISQIGAALPDLQDLSLSKCAHIRQFSLTSKSLRKLDLGWSHITSPTVDCPNLRTLDITGCRAMTQDSLLHLLESAGNELRSFWCSGATCADDPELWQKMSLHCNDLRYINASGCHRLDETSVGALIRSCGRNFKRIYLSGCALIGLSEIDHLQAAFPRVVFTREAHYAGEAAFQSQPSSVRHTS